MKRATRGSRPARSVLPNHSASPARMIRGTASSRPPARPIEAMPSITSIAAPQPSHAHAAPASRRGSIHNVTSSSKAASARPGRWVTAPPIANTGYSGSSARVTRRSGRYRTGITPSLMHADRPGGEHCGPDRPDAATAGADSARAMLLDVVRQRAQAGENAAVVRIVRAQLEPVSLGHGQRDLQRVDGIEPQLAAKERRIRIDLFGGDGLQVEALDDQGGQFVLCSGLLCHARFRTPKSLPPPGGSGRGVYHGALVVLGRSQWFRDVKWWRRRQPIAARRRCRIATWRPPRPWPNRACWR